MSYTLAEYAQAVWTNLVRTLAAGVPPAPDGSFSDAVSRAVWENSTRTLTGGAANFQINVSETMPVPAQTVTAASTAPASTIDVNEAMPLPTQHVLADAASAKKKKFGNAGVAFYPPTYPARTDIMESAPPPRQAAQLTLSTRAVLLQIGPSPAQSASVALSMGVFIAQGSPAPLQGCDLKSHRSNASRDAEDKLIMMLIGAA